MSMNQKLRITTFHEARGKSKTVLKSGWELETESNWFQSVLTICTILLQSSGQRPQKIFIFLDPSLIGTIVTVELDIKL